MLTPGIQEGQGKTVPVEGRHETTGGKQHGAHGEATALLIDPFEVAFGDVGHANSPGRAVEELVAIPRENTGSPSELRHSPLRRRRKRKPRTCPKTKPYSSKQGGSTKNKNPLSGNPD